MNIIKSPTTFLKIFKYIKVLRYMLSKFSKFKSMIFNQKSQYHNDSDSKGCSTSVTHKERTKE